MCPPPARAKPPSRSSPPRLATPSLTRLARAFGRYRSRPSASKRRWRRGLREAVGQNIRTRFPIRGCASTIACPLACLPLPTHPYSASRVTTKAEGGGDELGDLTGIYYRNGR